MRCQSVLVVEDDTDIRETLKTILELEGYEVATAPNGQIALERLKALARPCLILLDLMMPVMNGWEFLKVRRNDVILATIPVVIVSAVGESDRLTDTKAQGFIKKPIEVEKFLKTVAQYCRVPD